MKSKEEIVVRRPDKKQQTLVKGSATDSTSVVLVADPVLSDSKPEVGRGFKSHHARNEVKG